MNLRKRKTHSVSSQDWGWTARPFSLRLTAVGEVFVLTSPFIERGYRNVWSAAVLQAKNEEWQLVCANVFGLQWSQGLRAMMDIRSLSSV
jgi:hypothetical protein